VERGCVGLGGVGGGVGRLVVVVGGGLTVTISSLAGAGSYDG
jgi:hypothetical protein